MLIILGFWIIELVFYPRFAGDCAIDNAVQVEIGQTIDGVDGVVEPSRPQNCAVAAVDGHQSSVANGGRSVEIQSA